MKNFKTEAFKEKSETKKLKDSERNLNLRTKKTNKDNNSIELSSFRSKKSSAFFTASNLTNVNLKLMVKIYDETRYDINSRPAVHDVFLFFYKYLGIIS